jgi:hypothetical protein
MAQEGVVGLVALALLPQHLDWTFRWLLEAEAGASSEDGGVVVRIIHSSALLLRFVLTLVAHQQQQDQNQKSAATHAQILEAFHRTQLVRCLLTALSDHSAGGDTATASLAVTHAVYVLSELVLTNGRFLTQFVEGRGLDVLDSLGQSVFAPRWGSLGAASGAGVSASLDREQGQRAEEAEETLVSALQLASHLARHSEAHYQSLALTLPPAKLAAILYRGSPPSSSSSSSSYSSSYSSSASVRASVSRRRTGAVARAKCCNLIGNLCRHSARFYPLLSAHVQHPSGEDEGSSASASISTSVVAMLVECLGDEDASVRKFAAFAIGNAAFHSAALYPHLADSVLPLSRLLSQSRPRGQQADEVEDDKTKANAAGALGNLVRNGGTLASNLAQQGAMQALINASFPPPNLNNSSALSTARTALFSLGTAAAYHSCRQALTACSPSLQDLVAAVRGRPASGDAKGTSSSSSSSAAVAADEVMLKYLTRLKGKLHQGPAPE